MTHSPVSATKFSAVFGEWAPSQERIQTFFRQAGNWCQRQWTDLTDHPLDTAKKAGALFLFSAPVFLIEAWVPQLTLVIVISAVAIKFLAPYPVRWVVPHVLNGSGFAEAFFSTRNLCRFLATGSPACLISALIYGVCSALLFVAADRCKAI